LIVSRGTSVITGISCPGCAAGRRRADIGAARFSGDEAERKDNRTGANGEDPTFIWPRVC